MKKNRKRILCIILAAGFLMAVCSDSSIYIDCYDSYGKQDIHIRKTKSIGL